MQPGGHIVGKSACDDLCGSSMGYSSTDRYTHLPWSPDTRAGGSSGGSAVLVATGDVDLAIGGDQGGSIRIPAAWCGVVGLKPSFGLVPYTGIMSLEPGLDHVGPFTRTVFDCALFLEVLAGRDGMDHRQKTDYKVPEYSKLLEEESKFTIGILGDGFDLCDSEVQSGVRSFLDECRSTNQDLSFVDVTVPLHNKSMAMYVPIIIQDAFLNLQLGATPPIDGFNSTSLQKAVVDGIRNNGRRLSPGAKQFMIMGEILRRRYGNHYYTKARNIVLDLRRQVDEALTHCDVIVMPTLPSMPPKMIEKGVDVAKDLTQYLDESISMIGNTCVYNMTGHPALSLPVGEVGNPSYPGLMLVGKLYDDLKVLQVARSLEKCRDHKL